MSMDRGVEILRKSQISMAQYGEAMTFLRHWE